MKLNAAYLATNPDAQGVMAALEVFFQDAYAATGGPELDALFRELAANLKGEDLEALQRYGSLLDGMTRAFGTLGIQLGLLIARKGDELEVALQARMNEPPEI